MLLKTEKEAQHLLNKLNGANFSIKNIEKKPSRRTPAAPFTTSTLQQEASRKLGFSVSNTMRVAQSLYEAGKITYMRTDSVNLSGFALNAAKNEIQRLFGDGYWKKRQYTTKSANAQEAHEAIRPTFLNNKTIESEDDRERKLYELIWKRTVASQMADAELEKTTITISQNKSDETFLALGEIILFDGFLKVYMEGKVIYPGFIDGHCHFLQYGIEQSYTDLTGTTSFLDVTERIKKHEISKTGGWVIGRGWDQNDWEIKEFPTKEALDKLFPTTPVYLVRVDGHAALVNSKALELTGVTTTTHVDGGVVEVKQGQCTGILLDNALELVTKKMPTKSKTFLANAAMLAQEHCVAVGLTSVQDAGLDLWELQNLKMMDENGKWQMRIYAMANAGQKNYDYFSANGMIYTDHLRIRAFKYYADGALGSRGAGLLQPYSDDPANYGIYYFSYDSLLAEAQKIYNLGFQMCTHAIGDSANRMVLDIYGTVLQGKNDLRWRIEHCQVVNKNDFKKFSQFNILPAVQPTHATSDMYWADERLGESRIIKDIKTENIFPCGVTPCGRFSV